MAGHKRPASQITSDAENRKRARRMRSRSRTTRAQFRKPPRFAVSRNRYSVNRMISKRLDKFIETKYNPCEKVDEKKPLPIQTGARAYYQGYVIGDRPAAWDQDILPLEGIATQQGDSGVGERTGNYVYMKKNHFTLEIDMRTATESLQSTPLVQYRVVVCKARNAVIPSGQVPVPQRDLFLDLNNRSFSYQTSGINGTDLLRQPLNKRDWVIHRDMKFTLASPPTLQPSPGLSPQTYSQKYPSAKSMTFNLPFYKKTRFFPPQTGSLNTYPTDLDYHWLVLVFARPVDKDTQANNWETNVRAVTTYQDA